MTTTLLQIYCLVCFERIFKIARYLAKLQERKLTAYARYAPWHCPAERRRFCLRSDVGLWQAEIVATASRYDNRPR